MFVGAQCTNHSAVLRSSYSVAGMILERFEEERLMLLREIVKEGFSYLAGADAAHPVGDNFRGPFAELIIEEVQLSLLLSQTSSVSGQEYRSIVGQPTSHALPTVPEDLSFVFSAPPEPAETRKAAFDFQDRWINLSTPIFWHLEYVLAYSPTERTHSALDYCWETMEKVNMCINDCIKRILQDPRYRSDDARPRPNNCVTNLIVKDLNSYWLLRSCHNIVLQRENSKSSLLERSRKLWFDALFRSVQHLDVLYHCRRSSFGFYSHCTHLVHAARVCPRDILLQWAREHASHRERRSPTNLEIVQPLRQLQTRRRVASIGPSSPESRWSTKHMSYSLTYHLAQIGLDSLAIGYVYQGFDYDAFVSRLDASQGKLGSLDVVDQLFVLSQMHVGALVSNHS
ncbi:hypothetical protein JCM3765_002907, partial [Sporobolomyces pararoseus]